MRALALATTLLLLLPAVALAEDGPDATHEIRHDAIDAARQNCEGHLDDRRKWIEACTTAIESKRYNDPKVLSELYSELGWADIELALSTDKNFDKAIGDLDEAARIDPVNQYAFLNRAAAYMYRGDYQHSLDDANMVTRLDPKEGKAFAIRCTGWRKLNKPQIAIQQCQQAIALGLIKAWLYSELGAAYEAAGDSLGAQQAYRRALGLERDFPDAVDGWRRVTHTPPPV